MSTQKNNINFTVDSLLDYIETFLKSKKVDNNIILSLKKNTHKTKMSIILKSNLSIKKIPKKIDPNKPKKPISTYLRYSKHIRDDVKTMIRNNSNKIKINNVDINKEIGIRWNNFKKIANTEVNSEQNKQLRLWKNDMNKEMEIYKQNMEIYKQNLNKPYKIFYNKYHNIIKQELGNVSKQKIDNEIDRRWKIIKNNNQDSKIILELKTNVTNSDSDLDTESSKCSDSEIDSN